MKKGAVFLIVILAAQLDRITGNARVFRTSTSFFILPMTRCRLGERGEMGVEAPAFLTSG
jgi:phage-related holin